MNNDGSTAMRRRWMKGWAGGLLLVVLIASVPVAGVAGGLGFGVPFYTLNVLPALQQAPAVIDQAAQAWEVALIAEGLPPEVAGELAEEIEAVGDGISASIPAWTAGTSGILLQAVPIPHLGGALEFDLPFVVLDTLRFEAGWLSDAFALTALRWAEIDLGSGVWPIVVDWDEAVLSVAPEVRSLMLSTDVAKRIGLFIADIDLGFGVDWMCGRITPGITVLGGEFQETLGVLISGLHLETLRWSAFAVHGSVGIGIGPPFLRLYARIKGTVPISQSVSGGWPVTLGEFSGSVGMVIRF